MGDEEDGADGPRVEVVVQDEEIGSSVLDNGALHFGVGSVDDSCAQRLRLAFQLERRFAGWAEVVDSDGVARRDVKPWRFAGGGEKVWRRPRFGTDGGALGGALAVLQVDLRELQGH